MTHLYMATSISSSISCYCKEVSLLNSHITCTYDSAKNVELPYTGNFGGVKFWRIATVEANDEENFGGSNGRSSVVSVSL